MRDLPMAERMWSKLTAEERESSITEIKRLMKEGLNQRKLQPSLLGLDWEDFSFCDFPGHENDAAFQNPPEFVQIALATLDAYATAMLASDIPFEPLGALSFLCALRRSASNGGMMLLFGTDPEHGKIDADSVMPLLTISFTLLLSSSNIGRREDSVDRFATALAPSEVGDPGRCMLQLSYPGVMVAEKSPFLKNRGVDQWPSVILILKPTQAQCGRAREIVDFLRMSAENEGKLN